MTETFEVQTAQEVFETVARHLFAQGHQAKNEGGTCVLLDPVTQRRCAVGCLIPAAQYDPEMEENSVVETLLGDRYIPDPSDEDGDVISSGELLFPQLALLSSHQALLERLQHTHDTPSEWHSTETMRHALESVARRSDLDGAFLNDLSFSDR